MTKSHLYTILEHLVQQKHSTYGHRCYRCGKVYQSEKGLDEHKQHHFKPRVKLTL